jgi:hypothetical protein
MPRFSGRARRRDGGLGESVLGKSVVERFAHRNMHAASGFDEAKMLVEPPGGDVAEHHREIELTRPMSCFSMSASAEIAQ